MTREQCHRVLFQGNEYLVYPELTGPEVRVSSPLFQWEEFENFRPSFGHVLGEDIWKDHKVIGKITDLTWL